MSDQWDEEWNGFDTFRATISGILIVIGILLSLTGVGAVAGVPLIGLASALVRMGSLNAKSQSKSLKKRANKRMANNSNNLEFKYEAPKRTEAKKNPKALIKLEGHRLYFASRVDDGKQVKCSKCQSVQPIQSDENGRVFCKNNHFIGYYLSGVYYNSYLNDLSDHERPKMFLSCPKCNKKLRTSKKMGLGQFVCPECSHGFKINITN